MKKFLSVLLALAVAFTFTFGSTMSAFASVPNTATDGEYLTAVAAAEKAALESEADQYAAAVATVKAASESTYKIGGESGYVIDKANFYTALEDAYTAAKKVITNYTATIQQNRDNDFSYPVTSSAALIENAKDNAIGYNAAIAQLAADKTAAIKAIQSVDTSIYSSTKKDAVIGTVDKTDYYSSKEYADAVIAAAVAEISAIEIDTKADGYVATATYVKGFADNVAAILDATTDPGENNTYVLASDISARLLTVAAENQANAQLEAAKAQAKAQVQTYVAGQITYNLDSEELALFNELKAAYITIETLKIDTAKDASITVNTFPAYTIIKGTDGKKVLIEAEGATTVNATPSTYYVDNAKAYEADTALIASLKAKTTTDGKVYYDAKKIDSIYASRNQAYTTVTAKVTALTEDAFAGAAYTYGLTDFAKAVLKTNTAAELKGTESSYYAREWAEVEAALNAYNAAIDAATSTQATGLAKAALDEAVEKIAQKGAVEALYTTKSTDATSVYANYQTALTDITKYIASKNALLTEDTVDFATIDLYKWYAEQGARTGAEVAALYNTLKAAVDAAGTVNGNAKAKADAIKAVEDTISALPAKLLLTDADRDAVFAAKKAVEELKEKYGEAVVVKNEGILDDAVAVFAAKDRAAIEAAEKDLVDAAKATLADKDSINAAKALVDAYKDTYDKTFATNYNYARALANVKASELANVIDLINAIPTEVTEDAQEAIEAARAAYDAFVGEYTSYEGEGYDAAAYIDNYGKLTMAEATLAELTKYTVTNVKADLFDMSRKITIWRTSKSSIRVTAVGSVANIKANGYTVEYKFYKKAPGAKSYKLVKTTSSNKYTYKNLKKGTNMFKVKVVVKDADGKVVASKMTYYKSAKIK